MGDPKSIEENGVVGQAIGTPNPGCKQAECWYHGDTQHTAGGVWEGPGGWGGGDPWCPRVPTPTGDLVQQGVEAVATGGVEAHSDRGGRVAQRLGEAAAVDVILRQRLWGPGKGQLG